MKRPISSLPGWHRIALDTVGSTNTEAMSCFQAGDSGNLWVTAESQQAGKGRRGRLWHSPAGNLHASVLLVDPAPEFATATLPLLSAVALHEAIVDTIPALSGGLKIKWPNDILLDGSKVAGILLEAAVRENAQRGIVIGFGANCAFAPETGLYPTKALSTGDKRVSADVLFKNLARSVVRLLDLWDGGANLTAIRKLWLENAHGLGERVVAKFADKEIVGVFRELDDNGYLVLETADGTKQRISAADIFLGNLSQQSA